MKVWSRLDEADPGVETAVAVGTFDGFHVAHQRLIEAMRLSAAERGWKTLVFTFRDHPRRFFEPRVAPPLLTSARHKLGLIESAGVDHCVMVEFDHAIASIPAEAFVRDVLKGRLRAEELWGGYNWAFGRGGGGSIERARELGLRYGLRVRAVEPVVIEGIRVSSTAVRQLVEAGELDLASRLLGRPFSILATVGKGRRIGRALGYPTANLEAAREALPPSGVYAVRALVRGITLGGVLNMGYRPTFRGGEEIGRSLEVHLFDFGEDLYGEEVEIFFVRHIRDEIRFPTAAALARRIGEDEVAARKILKETKDTGCVRRALRS